MYLLWHHAKDQVVIPRGFQENYHLDFHNLTQQADCTSESAVASFTWRHTSCIVPGTAQGLGGFAQNPLEKHVVWGYIHASQAIAMAGALTHSSQGHRNNFCNQYKISP